MEPQIINYYNHKKILCKICSRKGHTSMDCPNIGMAKIGHGYEKKKVFDKFYRMGDEMTRSTKGTGLGLFLVKEIVSRNNGKISILDNAPSGCIFKLSFPIYTP